MGEITIPAGETVELVDKGSGGEWEVYVQRGSAKFHKLEQRASTHGRVRKSGDRGVVELGDREGLYAHAPASGSGATVAVDPNNFSFSLFSQREIVRPQDEAAEQARYDFEAGRESVAASTSLQTLINWTNNTGKPVLVTFAGGNIEGNWIKNARMQIEVRNADGVSQFIGEMDWPQLPFDFPEPVPCPPNGEVVVAVSNDTASSHTFQTFINYRTQK